MNEWLIDREDCDSMIALLEAAAAVTDVYSLDPHIRAFRAFVQGHAGRPSAEFLSNWLSSTERLARLGDVHDAQVLPQSAWAMWAILAFLSAVGVIAPLGFLIVGSAASPQKLLLSGFAVGLFGLMAYLGLTMRDLRRAGRLQLAPRDMADGALLPSAPSAQGAWLTALMKVRRIVATTWLWLARSGQN